ncbi:MAG: type II/IV secretion system protein [Verrucomicrobia bacterium]|nr:MAG: type II/IV secretion system protein [Verrucomicrobiota bacterium]
MSRLQDLLGLGRLFGTPSEKVSVPGQKAAAYLESLGFRNHFKAIEFFDLLLEDALHLRATDIHLVPDNQRVGIRLRIDGTLRDLLSLEPIQGKFLAGRMKVVAGMDTLKVFAPQDGAGRLHVAGEDVSFRVSSMPVQSQGEAQERVILRLFSQRAFNLGALGLDGPILARWQSLLDEPQGMLVLTGPANSGKTTTIYSSLLDILARSGGQRNIATIEDPVEFPVPGLSQSQVEPGSRFGFADAMRAMLRQDPQVIMVGEIRDAETARIAVEASLTGHLLVTTVHSKQVTGIFPRMLSLEVDAVRASSAVLAVLNQRLVRLNCMECLGEYQPAEASLRLLPENGVRHARWWRGQGCVQCGNTGFLGRTTVAELLVVDPAIRTAVGAGAPSQELYERAIATGMRTIWQNAMQLVLEGRIPLEEAVRILGTE